MKKLLIFLAFILFAAGPLQGRSEDVSEGLFALMETDKGPILIRLHYEHAPLTVANFIGLAEGTMEWHDPFTRERKKSRYFDGLIFHKVIPNLMIQGGDPKGIGQGGPGYLLDREITPVLIHDRPGVLSMLNQGDHAHGSRFFLTLGPAPSLNGRHTVFGQAVQGLDVIGKLRKGDRILHVRMLRKGAQAEGFDVGVLLEHIRQRAAQIEMEEKAARRAKGARQNDYRKDLPEISGETDRSRVPQQDQTEVDKVALEYILITHRGALTPREYQVYEREEAGTVAEHLARVARMEGMDFTALARQYSDSPDYKIPLLKRDGNHPKGLEPVFRLKEGQVSDPIHTSKGYMIFRRVRLDVITVRHILIAYQGAAGNAQTRTKEEARMLAETLLKRARAGEDFAVLAEKHSDSASAKKGGLIGEIARGMTLPPFDDAAFRLRIGEISEVTPTPSGFQLIQRVK